MSDHQDPNDASPFWWVADPDTGAPVEGADLDDQDCPRNGAFPAAVVAQAAGMILEVLTARPSESEVRGLLVNGIIPRTWGDHSRLELYGPLWRRLVDATRSTIADMWRTQFAREPSEQEYRAVVVFGLAEFRRAGRFRRNDAKAESCPDHRLHPYINPPKPGHRRRRRRPR